MRYRLLHIIILFFSTMQVSAKTICNTGASKVHLYVSLMFVGLFLAIAIMLYILVMFLRRQVKTSDDNREELLIKYKTIFDNAMIGIRLYDNQGKLLEANELSCSIYGVTKEKLFKTNNCIFENPIFSNIINRDHPEPYNGILENNYDELIKKDYFTIGLPTGMHYVETKINPLYDSTDHLKYIIVTFRDVTDMVNTQKQLKIEKEKAQTSDRLKSEFLANMSHEIRTPLNAIVGFSDVVSNIIAENEELRECSNLINKNSVTLLGLINDILDLSKIESGDIEIVNREFNISEMFDKVFSLQEKEKNNPAVDFICEKPYQTCLITSDEHYISHVLEILVSNAFKYTKKGYVKMTYECEDTGITIKVIDTGMGIPKDKQEMIFGRFEKLDTFNQGTGLGLSICKAIIERCGGKISVESEINEGSTFNVWFPCHAEIIK